MATTATRPFDPADSLPKCRRWRPLRPFEGLATLPADLNDAFEAFKLSIVTTAMPVGPRISCEDVLAVLDALRQFALAPAVL